MNGIVPSRTNLGGSIESYQTSIKLVSFVFDTQIIYSSFVGDVLNQDDPNGLTPPLTLTLPDASSIPGVALDQFIYLSKAPVQNDINNPQPQPVGYYRVATLQPDNPTTTLIYYPDYKIETNLRVNGTYDAGTSRLTVSGLIENHPVLGGLNWKKGDILHLTNQPNASENGYYQLYSNPSQPGFILLFLDTDIGNVLYQFKTFTNLFTGVASVKRGYHQLTIKSGESVADILRDETMTLTLFDYSTSESGSILDECRVIDFVGCAFCSTDSFDANSGLRVSTYKQFVSPLSDSYILVKRIFPNNVSNPVVSGDFSIQFVNSPVHPSWTVHCASTPTSGAALGSLLSSASIYRLDEVITVNNMTAGAGELIRNKSNIRQLTADARAYTTMSGPGTMDVAGFSKYIVNTRPLVPQSLNLVESTNPVPLMGLRLTTPGYYNLRWCCPAYGCDRFVSWLRVVNPFIVTVVDPSSVPLVSDGFSLSTIGLDQVLPVKNPVDDQIIDGVYMGSVEFSSSSSTSAVVESTGEVTVYVGPELFAENINVDDRGLHLALLCTPTASNTIAGKGLTYLTNGTNINPALESKQLLSRVIVTKLSA